MGRAAAVWMTHLVRPPGDLYVAVWWCVVYTLGSLLTVWGLWSLGGR